MSAAERYKRPEDLPQQIAVFPLHGCILLPRAMLPLNIFEPRYLAMIDRAMATSRIIGMIQPAGLGKSQESPSGKDVPLRQIGCAGRITSYQELDDGRYNITLTGITRFRLVDEHASATPFRICSVDYSAFCGDLQRGLGEDDVDRESILRTLKAYVDANRIRADLSIITRAPTEFLVNTLSIIAPYGGEEKQALLEASNLKARGEALVALAEMDLRASGSGSGSTLQ